MQVCAKPQLPSIVCYPPIHPAGRADYFGSVPNLAARLMAVAQPGQILVDGRLNSLQALQVCQAGVFSHACNRGLPVLQLATLHSTPPCTAWPPSAPQWREDGGAMMVSQDLGLIEFTPLGYLQVKVGVRWVGCPNAGSLVMVCA